MALHHYLDEDIKRWVLKLMVTCLIRLLFSLISVLLRSFLPLYTICYVYGDQVELSGFHSCYLEITSRFVTE